MANENTNSMPPIPPGPSSKGIPRWGVWIALICLIVVPILALVRNSPPKATSAGKTVPNIVFKSPTGEISSLENFRGKTVLVNFWASWCGPCMEEMGDLKQLQAKFSGRNFDLVLINVEEKASAIAPLLASGTLPGHVFVEPTPESIAPYDINSIPVSVLIGPAGELKKGYEGPRNWMDPKIVAEIDHAIQ